MNNARRMRLRQALRYLLQIAQQFSQLSLLAMDLFPQRRAFDILHRDEVLALKFINFINVSDIWVIQRGRGLRLLYEATHSILASGDVGRQYFQRHATPEFRIFSQIDFTHPTRTKLRADLVATKFCPMVHRHHESAEVSNQDHVARARAARERELFAVAREVEPEEGRIGSHGDDGLSLSRFKRTIDDVEAKAKGFTNLAVFL